MKRLFLTYLIIANLYFIFSNLPLVILYRRTPSQTVFPLYHSPFPYDYNVYLSVITLGQNGYWLNRDAFTSEKTTPGIFYFYYILVGKVSSLFDLSAPLAYHLSRFITAELFMIALYLVNLVFLGKKLVFWGSLFSTIATIMPPSLFGEERIISSVPWWLQLEALKRIDALPHHLFGQFFFLLSVVFIIYTIRTKKGRFFLLSLPCVFAAGFFLPSSLFPIILGTPLAALILAVRRLYQSRGDFRLFLTLRTSYSSLSRTCINVMNGKIPKMMMGILAVALLPLLLSLWQTQQGYPWSVWTKWEMDRWNIHEPSFNSDLLLSLAIPISLALPAFVKMVKVGNFQHLFVALWAALPFLLLPFVSFLGIGKIRLISALPFLPFSILSTFTLFKIIKGRFIRSLTLFLFFLVSLLTTFHILKIEIKKARETPFHTNIFIPQTTARSIEFIKSWVAKDSIILSNEFAGNIIPAYAPVKVYFGHINQTMNFAEKQKNVRLFLNQSMSEKEAKEFLRKNKITYIYFGPDEKSLGATLLPYNFLKPIFQNKDVTLYQVGNHDFMN